MAVAAHWSGSAPTSRSPASRCSTPGGESFAGGLSGGMATPTPDLPVPPPPLPLGVGSGLPLIPCPECGGRLVEEYIPAGGLCERCREDAGAHGSGCSFFKTQEEYEAIVRDRGFLGPAGATPEQGPGQGSPCYLRLLTPGASGFLVPVRNPNMVASMEDLEHEMAALNLAIAQLTTDISKGKLDIAQLTTDISKRELDIAQLTTDISKRKLDIAQLTTDISKGKLAIAQLKTDISKGKLAIAQLTTDISKGELGAGDKVQKAARTDSIVRWGKAIVKWFFVANAVVLLFGVVVAMSVE